ncbi:MAG: flagellar assembly protein FliW [Ignavibacteriae bacterium]|nr:flagellar assembly protein FliW [Ignavibacteriota bacterium]
MKIQNKQFGEIEYKEDSILKFKEGILGFEELKNFILINEKDSFFSWLTSVDQPEIIFPLFPIELLQEEFSKENNFEPYGIVRLDKQPENITINLKAPVFIDHNEKIGFQKISENEELPLDYPLFVNN